MRRCDLFADWKVMRLCDLERIEQIADRSFPVKSRQMSKLERISFCQKARFPALRLKTKLSSMKLNAGSNSRQAVSTASVMWASGSCRNAASAGGVSRRSLIRLSCKTSILGIYGFFEDPLCNSAIRARSKHFIQISGEYFLGPHP